jgi:hypothetical protein
MTQPEDQTDREKQELLANCPCYICGERAVIVEMDHNQKPQGLCQRHNYWKPRGESLNPLTQGIGGVVR